MALLLTLQFIALSVFPLYFTTLPAPMRQVHFYVYMALVLLVGGFLGNVYSVPIIDGVVISGGNRDPFRLPNLRSRMGPVRNRQESRAQDGHHCH